MSQKKLQQNISRLMALLLCLMLVLSVVPMANAAEGSCGDNLSWSFDGSTLTISGSGPMDNFSEESPAPWYSFKEQILKVSFPDGLTRIGSWAFVDCTSLSAVHVPGSVQTIGEYAFRRCDGITILNLNEGLRTIDECAFEQCSALADLRLPNTLINLNNHAFYMCDGLRYVTIPGAVRTIGSGVFCYCSNLIRVDINANVTMPGWSFYGCDQLEIVTMQGESVDPESLKTVTLPQGIPGYDASDEEDPSDTETDSTETPETSQPVSPAPSTGFASSETVTTGSSGEKIVENTTVTKTDNSTTISSTTTTHGQIINATTEITATVQNDQGWQDVLGKVNAATVGGNKNPVDVTVYLPNGDTVSADVLEEFADKNVNLTIQSQSGGKIAVDCNQLEKIKDDLVLGYTIVPAENIPEELEGCTVYELKFHEALQLNSEFVIRLPGGHSFSTATLFQMKGRKGLEQLQSVMVDNSGDSHWYLSAVDEKTDYLIGIDVPGAVEESPIIPKELHDVYKVENVYDGVEYVVTGRTSSWNMNLGQVMSILAVVMISVIVVVGVIMFIWNKKRLKSGYVPDWDDENE